MTKWKHQKEDTYLQKKDNKLLMNEDQYEKGCIFLEIIDELRLALKERYVSLEKDNKLLMN